MTSKNCVWREREGRERERGREVVREPPLAVGSLYLVGSRDQLRLLGLQDNLLSHFTGPEDAFVSSCFQKIVPEGKHAEYKQKAEWESEGFCFVGGRLRVWVLVSGE